MTTTAENGGMVVEEEVDGEEDTLEEDEDTLEGEEDGEDILEEGGTADILLILARGDAVDNVKSTST